MTYLAILLVMLVAFTVVGWPLISSSRGARRERGGDSSWGDLLGERDAAYRGIKELDFEYELGNLSESDYHRLRQRYRSEAATTLRKLDAAMSGGDGVPPSGPVAITEVASKVSAQAALSCPSCGKPVEAEDRHCWSCGGQLGRRCPNCAGSIEAGFEFCPGCGAHVEEA